MTILLKYFKNLSPQQIEQFAALEHLYKDWNSKINVISRKDIDELYERHILHSLGIAKVHQFLPNSNVMDVGTGGGFPAIPLAIMFTETQFYAIDVIAKKIRVVQEITAALGLKNIKAEQKRAELVNQKFDFIISRAVTNMPDFVSWVKGKIKAQSLHERKNGILYLKGGDLAEELKEFPQAQTYNLNEFFEEEFFETKKVVYLEFNKSHLNL
jgi:16S rRNA (guanine527-N7)-methyltransferase